MDVTCRLSILLWQLKPNIR